MPRSYWGKVSAVGRGLGAQKPRYLVWRKERENERQNAERSEWDARERENDRAILGTLVEEVRRYSDCTEKDSKKERRIGWIATVAAFIAAVMSCISLIAFWVLTSKANSTADTMADIYRRQLVMMEIDERPWLKVEPQVKFTEGSIKPPTDETDMIDLTLKLTNSGKTPAFFVNVVSGYKPMEYYDIHREQRELCLQFKLTSHGDTGGTTFPGDTDTMPALLIPEKGDIERAKRDRGHTAPPMGTFSPVYYGCVNYRSQFDSEWHQTGFAYLVGVKRPIIPGTRRNGPPEAAVWIDSMVPGAFFAD